MYASGACDCCCHESLTLNFYPLLKNIYHYWRGDCTYLALHRMMDETDRSQQERTKS